MVRTKPLNFAAVLLKGLLSGAENKDITELLFQARGARENFASLRTICDRARLKQFHGSVENTAPTPCRRMS